MLLTKEVEIRLWSRHVKYYNELGYEGKHGDVIIVKVEDLPIKSHVLVKAKCEDCDKEIEVRFSDYNQTCSSFQKYICPECAKKYIAKKLSEVMMDKYGVSNASQVEEFQKKKIDTYQKKYGVKSPLQCKEILNKQQQTILDKYGVSNISQLEEVKQQKKETNLKHFGVEYAPQSKQIMQKMIDTNLKRYGYSNAMQSPKIKEKVNQTLCKNGNQKTSIQQVYLHDIYGGELNHPIKYYSADICFTEEKLVIEYDGGFHNGRVKLGRLTQEEFKQKEIIRNNVIKREGYKQMRIISSTDKLPSDEILLQMLEHSRQYFSDYPNHSWIEFNIDTSTVRNAEQKDGVFFNYGNLRRIKKSDVQVEEKTDEQTNLDECV